MESCLTLRAAPFKPLAAPCSGSTAGVGGGRQQLNWRWRGTSGGREAGGGGAWGSGQGSLLPSAASSAPPAEPSARACSPAAPTFSAPVHLSFACPRGEAHPEWGSEDKGTLKEGSKPRRNGLQTRFRYLLGSAMLSKLLNFWYLM